MQRILLCLILPLCLGLAGCPGNGEISKTRAASIVSEAMGYPAPRARYLVRVPHGGGKYVAIIRELVVQGYLQPGHMEGQQVVHVPTDKGRRHVEAATYTEQGGDYALVLLDVWVAREVCEWVKEVRREEGSDRLVITYDAVWERAEPFYSLLCNSPECPYYGSLARGEQTFTVTVEQQGGRWRAVSVPEGA